MLKLFFVFLKLGIFTFGGGYAMIPLIKEEIVHKRKWLTEDEVLEIIAISESTPGPIAINMATYIGYRQKGVWGSLMSTLGVVIPSFVIIFLISLFFESLFENKYIAYILNGVKCGVAVLITKTGVEMLIKMKKKPLPIVLFVLALVAMLALEILAVNISAILLILFGGILSIIVFAITNKKNEGKATNKEVDV